MDETTLSVNAEGFSKAEFNEYVKNALRQIGKISKAYTHFFEAPDGQESLIKVIEDSLDEIQKEYDRFFTADDQGITKVGQLNKIIGDIKNYHQTLLSGEESIKGDIEETQKMITDFYVFLFGGNDGEEGSEDKVKKAIKDITEFHTALIEDTGYIKAVESAHGQILAAHDDLFSENTEGTTKVAELNKEINDIKAFHKTVVDEIRPFINEVQDDIKNKQIDVKALLHAASGGGLVDSFLKSKREYKQQPNYKKLENGSKAVYLLRGMWNIGAWLFSIFVILLDYILFICPLLLTVIIFIQPDLMSPHLSSYLSNLEPTGRLVISLPLWWISWFGQRNISHKRRLAEEYNHKAQVAIMYLNFASETTATSYPLDEEAKKSLNSVLIDAIARHPGRVYGKDETILDKVIKLICAGKLATSVASYEKSKN